MKKVATWKCLYGHKMLGLFLSVYVDEIRTIGRKQNVGPMWKRVQKEIDLEYTTLSIDQVFLGCTLWEAKVASRSVQGG